MGSIVKQLPDRFFGDIEGHTEQTRHFHPAIPEALRKRRAKTATTLMRDHIMSGTNDLVAVLDEHGLWAEDAKSSA
ncbi:hypothetical protein [Nocardia lijiangensis]|uniref:hypothetical protein n=1 Tax=Nocardia lijiangensis TaxID=299618 RepID=UPI000B20F43C|nr:hypothetical protein [Nocardia lijiangensis]